ncbi:MAG: molybdopterin molybdenumtransferase MoeA, partial [Corynebacterium sp.]|nr:molybdopterin molybdenumtransferase MoeA [Corynebacterium sp.]
MSGHTTDPVGWAETRRRIVAALAPRGQAARSRAAVTKRPAPGDVLHAAVTAPMDVPHYASSAMDGFAV